jgi:hypothetical protein
MIESIKKKLGRSKDPVQRLEEEISQPGDIEGLEAFLGLCDQAGELVAKATDIVHDDETSEEERLMPLRETIRELSRIYKRMKGLPQHEDPRFRKSQKRFMNGLGDYIYGCKAYADYYESGNRWYIGYALSSERSGIKNMDKARQDLTGLSKG